MPKRLSSASKPKPIPMNVHVIYVVVSAQSNGAFDGDSISLVSAHRTYKSAVSALKTYVDNVIEKDTPDAERWSRFGKGKLDSIVSYGTKEHRVMIRKTTMSKKPTRARTQPKPS